MKKPVIVLVIVSIVINILTAIGPLAQLQGIGATERFSPTASGIVSLVILSSQVEINITSPLNQTYNFDYDQGLFYTMNLSVTSSSVIDTWWYSSESLEPWGGSYAYEQPFTPNITIQVRRGSNNLTVWANDSGGRIGSANVIYYVNSSNSAPALYGLEEEIVICEGAGLTIPYNTLDFNAVDYDGDAVTFSDSNGQGMFFIHPNPNGEVPALFGVKNWTNELFTASNISKASLVGNPGSRFHQFTVSVDDGYLSDSGIVNITMIEINNVPDITNAPGAQTLWIRGEDRTFDWDLMVQDDEIDLGGWGALTYNLTFLQGNEIFNISSDGRMNFTANSSYLGGNNSSVYLINISINDSALINRHPNISFECGQDGSSWDISHQFYLTITNDNRAPRILDYNPKNLSISSPGMRALNFNITVDDPDGGFPDVIWEVDGSVVEVDSLSGFQEFDYAFPCGVGGERKIVARVTDGLNDTLLQWNVSVSVAKCPEPPLGGEDGGGGGGGTPVCTEAWACNNWETCRNAADGLNLGVLTGEDFRLIEESCKAELWGEELCGFQNRLCEDANSCGTTFREETSIQACHYVLNPSCSDGVENCHDGSCEFLVDCGGPCAACATCSDNVQNQGEEGVDCGGPCPFNCPAETPRGEVPLIYWIIGLVIIVLLIVVIVIVYRIRKLRKSAGIAMGVRKAVDLR